MLLPSPISTEPSGPAPIRNLYAAAMSYNGYTVTDGALRLIVLFNAARLGFSAIEIALMFSLYEVNAGCWLYRVCTIFGDNNVLFITDDPRTRYAIFYIQLPSRRDDVCRSCITNIGIIRCREYTTGVGSVLFKTTGHVQSWENYLVVPSRRSGCRDLAFWYVVACVPFFNLTKCQTVSFLKPCLTPETAHVRSARRGRRISSAVYQLHKCTA